MREPGECQRCGGRKRRKEGTQRAPWQPHRELLALLEGEAPLADLLAPAAALVRVAHHHVLVAVRAEAGVDVQGEVRLAGADVHAEAAAMKEGGSRFFFSKSGFVGLKMFERCFNQIYGIFS